MTAPDLTVRRLLIDLSSGFARHWNGNDAFRTALANALSMSFPVGEQFFIDAVRNGLQQLPHTTDNDGLRQNARDFIGQEATHRHLHGQFNQHLKHMGLVNHWGPRVEKRLEKGRRAYLKESEKAHLHELAITAAYEHFTAIFGQLTLERAGQPDDWFAGAQEPLQTLWRWHAAEEFEHKSVALDLYRQLGGNEAWRRRWFYYAAWQFMGDCVRQTLHNLWRDGSLLRPGTWRSAVSMLIGRHGLLWRMAPPVKAYLREGFHPNQLGDAQLARRWLQENRHLWAPAGDMRP